MLKKFENLNLNFNKYELLRRKLNNKKNKTLIISLLVSTISIIWGVFLMYSNKSTFGIFVIIASLVIFIILNLAARNTKTENIRNIMLNDLIQAIDNKFTYLFANDEFDKHFSNSAFFDFKTFNVVNDALTGKINDNNFGMCEIYAADSDYPEDKKTVFDGFFAFYETKKIFEQTVIKSIQFKSNSDKMLIETDNNFEKYFEVITKNENQKADILSPVLKNFLMENVHYSPIFITLNEKYLYLGLDNRKKLFEINLNKKIDENTFRKIYDNFENYFKILKTIVSLV